MSAETDHFQCWKGWKRASAFNAFNVGSGERSVSLVGDIKKLRAESNDTGLLLPY